MKQKYEVGLVISMLLVLTTTWTWAQQTSCLLWTKSSDMIIVATDGVDSAGCGTSAAPCQTIQQGINVAYAFDIPIVFVKSGTYTMTADWTNLDQNHDLTLQAESGATLNFGYQAINISSEATTTIEGFTMNRTGNFITTISVSGSGTIILRNNVITSTGQNCPVIWFHSGTYGTAFTGTATLEGNTVTVTDVSSMGIPVGGGTVTMSGNIVGPSTPNSSIVAIDCQEDTNYGTLIGDGTNQTTGSIQNCGPSVPDCATPSCTF